jgi:hypothetical protein
MRGACSSCAVAVAATAITAVHRRSSCSMRALSAAALATAARFSTTAISSSRSSERGLSNVAKGHDCDLCSWLRACKPCDSYYVIPRMANMQRIAISVSVNMLTLHLCCCLSISLPALLNSPKVMTQESTTMICTQKVIWEASRSVITATSTEQSTASSYLPTSRQSGSRPRRTSRHIRTTSVTARSPNLAPLGWRISYTLSCMMA